MEYTIRKLNFSDQSQLKSLILEFKQFEHGFEPAWKTDAASVDAYYESEFVAR